VEESKKNGVDGHFSVDPYLSIDELDPTSGKTQFVSVDLDPQ